jgi:hypothetical protein
MKNDKIILIIIIIILTMANLLLVRTYYIDQKIITAYKDYSFSTCSLINTSVDLINGYERELSIYKHEIINSNLKKLECNWINDL